MAKKQYQALQSGLFTDGNWEFAEGSFRCTEMQREVAAGTAEILPYAEPQLTREQIDALRRSAYSARCAPLLEEAQIKRHRGLSAEADALEAQAYQERLVIQQEHPWPVETTP